ncbi:acyl-CoA dehydratase activase [Ruminococcaceae bacterium OttesenSCG-928-O06]|nr:acyl-CoA dehydratase activase [Ruminococcaceae bacterium OttesenSCG-928-O06]
MLTMGIDIGSASSKVVILRDAKEIVAAQVVPFGTGSTGPQRAMAAALQQAGCTHADMDAIVATGYGRMTNEYTDMQVSEISCHAKGIFFLIPEARTVIDIGGQDVKAIRLNDAGHVQQFMMNDKCAAGTGRFLEVMARVLEVELTEMGAWHEKATTAAPVSSTCTVFAESEVISQLSKGTPKADIIAGVHKSVANKTCGLARRVGVTPTVVMSGGVGQNSGVVKAIEAELEMPVQVAPNPQIIGALGAALYAAEKAPGAATA